jgi:hypothetical protein
MISVEKIKTSSDTSGFSKLVVEAQEEHRKAPFTFIGLIKGKAKRKKGQQETGHLAVIIGTLIQPGSVLL